MSADHSLKILPIYYKEVIAHRKTFEIRENDRNFLEGQTIYLTEFDGENYTGRYAKARIGFICDYEQKPGWVVFSLLGVVDFGDSYTDKIG